MPKKILVADDERHIVRLIQVNLERAGYEVIPTYEGKEALEKIALENPDLVVLDVMMPYMPGFEVLERLRRAPATRDLPVIMLTAKAPDADVFRGWQSGVDCYLTKPFNPMELISFVKRIFAAQEGEETDWKEPSRVTLESPSASEDAPQPPVSHAATPQPPDAAPHLASWWQKMGEGWRKIGF